MIMMSGCAQVQEQVQKVQDSLPKSGTTTTSATDSTSDYNGRRAKLTVLRFVDATGGSWGYNRNTGDSMSRKLSSALLKTNKFRMLDRRNVKDMMDELDFGASGAVERDSAARFGRMTGARLVVTAVITDFEENTGSSSIKRDKDDNLLNQVSGFFGSTKAYMAVNIEVVDVETTEIIASEQVEAKITDLDSALNLGPLEGALSSWENQPRGQALQKVINQAVDFLAAPDNIPSRYFTEAPAKTKVATIRPDNVAVKMQQILKELGYYSGAVDGQIGPESAEAIQKFQQENGLDVTGALDPETREKLLTLAAQ
jgi:curli biogenesis system outer membrane secretion channel CsgG